MTTKEYAIECKNIRKTYVSGSLATVVLKGASLSIRSGEFVALMGKSGAGKSTLFFQLGLLDRPTSGEVNLLGRDVLALSDDERTRFRLENLGYIFQDYALIPGLSALENVMLPMLMLGKDKDSARDSSREALESVDLGHRLDNLPNELSGGEQQRVSIARAIVQKPAVLFADEPTANLDSVSSALVLEVLSKLHAEGQTILMITHEREYGEYAERILFMEDGLITKDEALKKTP